MKAAVVDAGIFIDLLQTGLLSAFISLGYINYAPPDIVAEVKEDNRQILIDAIQTGKILAPTIEDLDHINLLNYKYRPLSYQDCTCLYMAIKESAILFTSEKQLRKIAKGQGLEVHGILFILDELIKVGQISYRIAHEKLSYLIRNGTFLPIDECNKRLRSWERKR